MWFWLSIIALLCWSGSDLFSKIGCREKDKYAQFKMVTAVGVVMGLHAAYEIFVGGVEINLDIILKYLPVSLLYIVSMIMGYVSLRYIELSISSPICNASGACVALVYIFMGEISFDKSGILPLVALVAVCTGVIGLGFVESHEDDELRAARQLKGNFKYAKSALAIVLPVLYCALDAAGTFADSLVLRTLNEDSANVAYELTFLIAGILCFIYVVLIKKQPLVARQEKPKYIGAIFETAGQLAYIYAIGDEEHVMYAAPIISAYCIVSMLWSRIFLKEQLSKKHYLMLGITLVGVIILGILDL